LFACAIAAGSLVACSDDDGSGDADDGAGDGAGDDGADGDDGDDGAGASTLGFFVTSSTQDGNLGGLDGADAICQSLADDVGAGDRTWRAYLSAENGGAPIHARDRIGTGPWFTALDVMLAADLEELHSLTGDPDLFVTESGWGTPTGWARGWIRRRRDTRPGTVGMRRPDAARTIWR
jgi:hypothetical protein